MAPPGRAGVGGSSAGRVAGFAACLSAIFLQRAGDYSNKFYPALGNLPIPLLKGVFPFGWPAIASAAVFGILLNLLFLAWKPPQVRSVDVLE